MREIRDYYMIKVNTQHHQYANNSLPSNVRSASTDDIDAAERKLSNIGEIHNGNLMTALKAQREAINTVTPPNKETAISDSLLEGIDNSALELELINAWTEGGSAVIPPMLDIMLKSIFSDGKVEGTEYEDLVLIMLIDLLVNKKETGITQEQAGFLTEWIGSGMHKDRTANKATNQQLAEYMNTVYQTALQDSNSVANKAAVMLQNLLGDDNQVNAEFKKCMDNYTSAENGFYMGTNGAPGDSGNENPPSDKCDHLSPILRLMVISTASKNVEISAEDWATVLTGTPNDIEKVLNNKNIFQYIINNSGNNGEDDWQWYNPDNDNDGHFDDLSGFWLDFNGAGISGNYLNNLFSNFPSRVLTDEELKDINRIGDNVKMIMQTLKYWYQILRDERVAIARNI
ncbi:molecular chaperone [Vibrio parahaemolyticus]|nr:molecular chaperone [Vibrio parahaemolyticus]